MRAAPIAAAVALAGLAASCASEPTSQGFEEPVRVIDGQFREGELPGLPPLTPEQIAEGELPVSPTVTSAEGAGGILLLGDVERTLRGRVTGDAVALGFRFEDLGSGYWIEPARGPDPIAAGEYGWSFDAEFLRGLPQGPHRLLFAAIGPNGESGTQLDATICVANEVPDNGNACRSRERPPAFVISLSWDENADVDLSVVTPGDVLVDAGNPATEIDNDVPAATAGVLDRDSTSGCVFDGQRRESLVYQAGPPSGEYVVFANLFDACGAAAVRFTVTAHVAEDGDEPDTFRQVETFRRSGILLASQANGGAKTGLRAATFVVP